MILFRSLVLLASVVVVLSCQSVFAQAIPDDSVHLPQKIGSSKSGLSKVDTVTVSGKISFTGVPAGEAPPVAYVAVFKFGRLVGRRQASQSGSFTLNDVPREGSTIVVEIENIEVASSQIVPTPGDTVFRDFTVNWNQTPKKSASPGVVSAKDIYARTEENQKRYESAIQKLNGDRPEAAISQLKSLTTSDPQDFPAWTELGNAYLLGEKPVEAGAAFDAALTANPSYLSAQLGKGRALVMGKDYDKAIEILNATVSTAPSSADAQHYLGEAYLLAKKGSKAVGHLNEALRLAPIRKAEIHLQLAALYKGAKLNNRAALEYKQFLDKMPKYENRKELQKFVDENLKEK